MRKSQTSYAMDLVDGLDYIVKKHSARLRYLAHYLPGFKLIELIFIKLQTGLCTARSRTRALLEEAIVHDDARTTEQDAKNWFGHCAYHAP